MGIRTLALVLLGLAAGLLPAPASAQAGLTLGWQAPAACPAQPAVRADVDRLLPGADRLADGLSVHGVVRETSDGFELLLSMSRGGLPLGTRTLVDGECELVARAAALVVALAIDPDGVDAAAIEEGAAPAEALSEPSAGADVAARGPVESVDGTDGGAQTLVAATVDSPVGDSLAALSSPTPGAPQESAGATETPGSGRDGAFRLRSGMVVEGGVLPGAGAGVALALGARLGPVVVEVDGSYWPSRRAAVDNHDTAAVDVALLTAGAGVLLPLVEGDIELSPRVGLEVGRANASSSGVSDPGSGGGAWVAARAGMAVAWPVAPWLALRADADLVIGLARPEFVLDGGIGVVHQPSAASGRLGLGAEVRFP